MYYKCLQTSELYERWDCNYGEGWELRNVFLAILPGFGSPGTRLIGAYVFAGIAAVVTGPWIE